MDAAGGSDAQQFGGGVLRCDPARALAGAGPAGAPQWLMSSAEIPETAAREEYGL